MKWSAVVQTFIPNNPVSAQRNRFDEGSVNTNRHKSHGNLSVEHLRNCAPNYNNPIRASEGYGTFNVVRPDIVSPPWGDLLPKTFSLVPVGIGLGCTYLSHFLRVMFRWKFSNWREGMLTMTNYWNFSFLIEKFMLACDPFAENE